MLTDYLKRPVVAWGVTAVAVVAAIGGFLKPAELKEVSVIKEQVVYKDKIIYVDRVQQVKEVKAKTVKRKITEVRKDGTSKQTEEVIQEDGKRDTVVAEASTTKESERSVTTERKQESLGSVSHYSLSVSASSGLLRLPGVSFYTVEAGARLATLPVFLILSAQGNFTSIPTPSLGVRYEW